jgi:hypothetical protein
MREYLNFEESFYMDAQKSTLTDGCFQLLISDMTEPFKYAILSALNTGF